MIRNQDISYPWGGHVVELYRMREAARPLVMFYIFNWVLDLGAGYVIVDSLKY